MLEKLKNPGFIKIIVDVVNPELECCSWLHYKECLKIKLDRVSIENMRRKEASRVLEQGVLDLENGEKIVLDEVWVEDYLIKTDSLQISSALPKETPISNTSPFELTFSKLMY